ncbi:HNH endonuclease [Rhodobacter capsulatus]|uniref:HNH endonuclease n=1 Tax=Rhodobacter capsulatus TaxID=1061 RepID=UPI004027B13C
MTIVTKDLPDAARLHELFSYDPTTGDLLWKKPKRGSARVGDIAGCNEKYGYRRVRIDGKKKQVHRIIWTMFNGDIPEGMLIDHKDGNTGNNRLENLRLATRADNNRNRAMQKNNTTGFPGVTFRKITGKWEARIRCDCKKIHLGTFDTPDLANLAYITAAENLHGDFASHKSRR